jgi:hypothetical protein
MGAMNAIGRITTRGLVSLVIAYALIVKMVIASAAATVVLPSPGQAPVICLSDHALVPDANGGSGPVDTHHCDDCSLARAASLFDPVAEPAVVPLPSPVATAVEIGWAQDPDSGPAREAWGPWREQRGPPATTAL